MTEENCYWDVKQQHKNIHAKHPEERNIKPDGTRLAITGVIQMMLPVLSSESFGYHHMQFPAVVPVLVDGSKKNTRDFVVIRDN